MQPKVRVHNNSDSIQFESQVMEEHDRQVQFLYSPAEAPVTQALIQPGVLELDLWTLLVPSEPFGVFVMP